MTTSGIVGGLPYNANNCLIFSNGSSYSYSSGSTLTFSNIELIGPEPACSLNTSTGIFTCNLAGCYIIHITPYLQGVPNNVGFTGNVYVNGSLYHTCATLNGSLAFTNSFMNIILCTMIVGNPGDTFYFTIDNTAGSAHNIQSGASGGWGDVLFFA